MYFFNVNGLARDLKDEKVDQENSFKYLLGVLLLVVSSAIPFLLYWSFSNFAWTENFYSYIAKIGFVRSIQMLLFRVFGPLDIFLYLYKYAVLIIGTYLCYKVNKQHDNKDFIKRFICLSWPVSLYWGFIVILIAILSIISIELLRVLFIYLNYPIEDFNINSMQYLFYPIMLVLFDIGFYVILRKKMRFVAAK